MASASPATHSLPPPGGAASAPQASAAGRQRAESSTTVYLPIDVKVREFDASLLLACLLAERGCRTILAPRGDRVLLGADRIWFPQRGRSVILGRQLTAGAARRYRMQRRVGNILVALDEESLVIYSPEIYLERRVGAETIRLPHALFACGEASAALWREELGDGAATVHVTGNPRFDLLRSPLREIYRPQAERLQARFGPYVLFNSNFHWVNTRHRAYTRLPAPEDVAAGRFPVPAFYNPDLARHRIALFRAYLEALPRLARSFPELHFVIRPHPSEDPDPWCRATAGLSNCSVVCEGPVVPWLLGARALLHHSCTTAVEAVLLDRPAVSYRPVIDEHLDPELPIAVSLEAHSLEDLERQLQAAVGADHPRSRVRGLLARHLAAMEGPLAAERIADALLRLDAPVPPFRERLAALPYFAWKWSRAWWQGHRGGLSAEAYPPTSLLEARERILSFRRLLDRFHRVHIRTLRDNVFEVTHDLAG